MLGWKPFFLGVLVAVFLAGFWAGSRTKAINDTRYQMREDFFKGIGMLLAEVGDREDGFCSGPVLLFSSPKGLRWTRYLVARFIKKGVLDISLFLNIYSHLYHNAMVVMRRPQDRPYIFGEDHSLPYRSIWQAVADSDEDTRTAVLGFSCATLRWFRVARYLSGLADRPPEAAKMTPDKAKDVVAWMLDEANDLDWRSGRIAARVAAATASLLGVYKDGLMHSLRLKPYIFGAYISEGARNGQRTALLAFLAWLDVRTNFIAGASLPWLGLGCDPDGDDFLLSFLPLVPFIPKFKQTLKDSTLFTEAARLLADLTNQVHKFLKTNFTRLRWNGFRWTLADEKTSFPQQLFSRLKQALRNALSRWGFHGCVSLGLGYWRKLASTLE